MYSFDHDLGHFVSIGSATVSDDATVVTSDPGVGVVKAGWHCGSRPVAGVCVHKCPECQKCTDPPCRCDPEELCSDCEAGGSACDGEGRCKTGQELIPKICDQLGQLESQEEFLNCENVPDLAGHEGLCGAAGFVTYDEITHSCDGVDLEGAVWNEDVTTDGGCEGSGLVDIGRLTIQKGNKLAVPPNRARDYFYVCRVREQLPRDYVCAEILIQKIFVDDCLIATKEITLAFSYLIDENGVEECVGTFDRRDAVED